MSADGSARYGRRMTGPALPPRPNRYSGEPRPPHAPRVAGAWTGHRQRGRRVESYRPAQAQDWFRKRELMLELVEARRQRPLRSIASYAVVTALVFIVGGALIMSGPYRTDLNDPVPYVIVAVLWLISNATAYLVARTRTLYAGATWAGDAESKDKIISTYELSRIKIWYAHSPRAMLQMIAPDGFFLELPLGLVEGNPALWDLIYNGLRHSTAAGAEVDATTREILRLPAIASNRAD